MNIINQKAKAYKRGVIKSLIPFYMSGLVTVDEIEYIADSSTVKAVLEGVIR